YFVHRRNEPVVFFAPDSAVSSNGEYMNPSNTQTLRCRAEGNPKPTYKWTKNGNAYDPSAHLNRVVVVPNEGSLLFHNLTSGDEGVYQCEAINAYGAVLSEKVILQRAC
ncbi:Neuroglian, partial [Toxocara canis]